MEHPDIITDRTAAVDYMLRCLCGHTPSMRRALVRENLEEQTTAWLLDTANRALNIRVEQSERRAKRRAQQQRADS